MNINNRIETSLELKIADWELDFYSRPIIESNGKKRWELIICSTRSYKTEEIFLWNKKCPANEVNSVWLTKALNEAISDAKKQGWEKPSIVRFWRSSMKSIIKKSLEALSIEAIVSRRTYDLLDRIEFLEKEIYPKEKGYVRGVLAPTFTSKIRSFNSKEQNLKTPISFYKDGLLVAGLSPKALLFFGTIFPTFINFSSNIISQFLILLNLILGKYKTAPFSVLKGIFHNFNSLSNFLHSLNVLLVLKIISFLLLIIVEINFLLFPNE